MVNAIDIIWERIQAHAGETFLQVRGAPFTYAVNGGAARLSRTNHQIPRSHFEKALALERLEKVSQVQHLRGPSYIFAILADPRIRGCGS